MEPERIVFEIDITSYLKQLEEAGKMVDSLKKKHTELAIAAGNGSAAAAAEMQRLNARITDLEKQITVGRKALVNFNFNMQNTVQVTAAVTNQLNIAGKGANQVNTAMAGAAAGAGQLSQALNTAGNEAEKTEKKQSLLSRAWELVKAVLKSFVKAIGETLEGLKGVPGSLGRVAGGLLAMGKAFTAATGPVGLVINLLTGLWDILKGNSEVALEMSAAIAGINKAVDIVIDAIVEFGKGVIDAFSSPEKYMERFLTHLKGVGLLLEGIFSLDTTKIFDGFVQGAFGITDATKKAGEFVDKLETAAEEGRNAAKQLDALTLATARMNAEVKKNEQAIGELNKKLKEKNLSEDERLRIAEKIANKEIENVQKAAAVKKAAYDAEALMLKGKVLSSEQQAKLLELQTAAQLAAKEALIAADEKAMRIDELMAEHRAELEAQRLQNIENEREQRSVEIDLLEDSLNKRQRLFDLESEKEEEAMRERGVKEEQITAWRNKRMKEIADEYNKEQAGKRTEQLAEQAQHLQAQAQLEIDAVERSTMNEYEKAEKKRDILLRSMQEQLDIAKQVADADGERTQQEIDNLNKLQSEIDKTKDAIANRKVSLAESMGITSEDMEAINTGLKAAADVVSSIGDVISTVYERRMDDINATKEAEIAAIEESGLSEKEKQKKKKEAERKAAMETYEIQLKQFKANKAISIVQTIIATAQAVMAQLSNPTPYVGIVLAALAAATGAVQIGLIASQKPPAPPKFAKGVIGLPGPGSETSDSIQAYLSKGESVITAKATKRFAPMLAQMEMAVGNIPNYNYTGGHFATGVIGDGGFYARESVKNVQSNVTMQDAITQGFRNAPQPVVSVQEITRVNNNVNRSVKVSEL